MADKVSTIVLVDHEVIASAQQDAAAFAGRQERGGILLGTRRGPHIHAIEATLPQLGDRGSMFSFIRGSVGHRDIALKRWRASRQTIDWLGEWHSHPEPVPQPSTIDLHSWRGLVRRRGAPMLFIIFGYREMWIGLLSPARLHPVRLLEAERSPSGIAFVTERASPAR